MTYFHERDLPALTFEQAVRLATREAQAVSEIAQENEISKLTAEDTRRRAELSLGEILFYAPGDKDALITTVSQASNLTKGALKERMAVYAESVEADVMEALLELKLGYTNHRTIVGIRVKSRGTVSVNDRVMAALRSVERNEGVFKADDEFYAETRTLPPPNNFDRMLANLEGDPDFRSERLTSDVQGRLLDVMLNKNEPLVEEKARLAYVYARRPANATSKAARVTLALNLLLDAVEEIEGEVPEAILAEVPIWTDRIDTLRDIASVRAH